MINYWLDRKGPLVPFLDTKKPHLFNDYGAFICLDIVYPAHKANDILSESLKQSWQRTHNYVENALDLLQDGSTSLVLEKEEVYEIKSELGEPPPQCYPLYFITIKDDPTEKLVYIGKTSSEKSRFKGGHLALTKLLHPKYDGYEKKIYFATIVFLTKEKDYLPLEWVHPLKSSNNLLTQIEARLITHFKPVLNKHHINTKRKRLYTMFHMQNFTQSSSIFHDEFIQI